MYPAPPEIYTLSLHDALPIFHEGLGAARLAAEHGRLDRARPADGDRRRGRLPDRKSTRLNSSHRCISYAVFCLKKKKIRTTPDRAHGNLPLPRGSTRSILADR